MVGSTSIDDLGNSWHSVDENPLKPGLQRDRRCRTRHTRPDELHSDQTSFFIDIVKQNIAVIGLNCRTDHFNDFLYLFTHPVSLRNDQRHATSGCPNPISRARLER